jgi:hypothetical protein
MREDLTIGGAVLLIAGIFLSFIPYLAQSYIPFMCFVGPVLIVAGLVLLLIGIVMSEDKPPQMMYVQQQYPPQYRPQQPPAKPFCSNCGGRVNPNEKFCSHCGSQIP